MRFCGNFGSVIDNINKKLKELKKSLIGCGMLIGSID